MQPGFVESNLAELKKQLDEVGGLVTPEEWTAIHAAAQGRFENFENIENGVADENGFLPLEPFEPSTRENLPMFPVDRLPQGVADYIKAVSESVQVAPDMIATSVLASAATAVQRKYMVHPVADWMEPLNLYAVTIAEPSERKSPVFQEVTRPIEEYEERR